MIPSRPACSRAWAQTIDEGIAPICAASRLIRRTLRERKRRLAESFDLCSHGRMTQLNASELAAVLATVPVSQIAGLLAASPDWKARAAAALAADIVMRLDAPTPADRNQLSLCL